MCSLLCVSEAAKEVIQTNGWEPRTVVLAGPCLRIHADGAGEDAFVRGWGGVMTCRAGIFFPLFLGHGSFESLL